MIYINIDPGMFLRLAVCVWEDPGPFPYLEISREENQSEPKRLIDWLMFLDKQRRVVRDEPARIGPGSCPTSQF